MIRRHSVSEPLIVGTGGVRTFALAPRGPLVCPARHRWSPLRRYERQHTFIGPFGLTRREPSRWASLRQPQVRPSADRRAPHSVLQTRQVRSVRSGRRWCVDTSPTRGSGFLMPSFASSSCSGAAPLLGHSVRYRIWDVSVAYLWSLEVAKRRGARRVTHPRHQLA